MLKEGELMKHRATFLMFPLVFFVFSKGGLAVGKYSVSEKLVEGHKTYHLVDAGRKMEFGVVPDVANLGYEFKVNNEDVLIPLDSFKNYVETRRLCCGIPFLAPWANRIDQDYYFFQEKKYLLNDSLGNLFRDQFKQAIHGLLARETRWEVVKTGASDSQGAAMTSRLEFYKYPDLMAQFPFAHTIELTYRLKDGKLETTTTITNVGRSAMPVMIAFHPYFRPDGERNEWTLSIGATKHWKLSPKLTATGENEPTEKFLPQARSLTLDKTFLDDLFSDLQRGPNGLGRVSVKGKTHKVEVVYSKEFDFAVVYAPLDRTLICIEPQTAPTNAFNLNHEGKYPGLDVLEPGKVFKASFWIVPTGF